MTTVFPGEIRSRVVYPTAVLLFLLTTTIQFTSASASTTLLQQLIEARCGPKGYAVWVYSGHLYDPLNGKSVAPVQGVELVRQLPATTQTQQKHTLLTRRLFLYEQPKQDSKQQSRLLQSIRLRPNSPLRRIPMEQTVSVFDSATTYREDNASDETPPTEYSGATKQPRKWPWQPSPIRNNKQKWHIRTEWPNGKYLSTIAEVKARREASSTTRVEFALYARPGHRPVDSSHTVSPPRQALIQVGNSAGQSNNNTPYGARETYHYTMDPAKRRFWPPRQRPCRVHYTRYGEGPVWYGPGRYCVLELTGERVESMRHIPRLVATVAAHYVPGFLAVHGPSTDRSLEWFRQYRSQVIPPVEDTNDDMMHLPKRTWQYTNRVRLQQAWEKWKQAMTWRDAKEPEW